MQVVNMGRLQFSAKYQLVFRMFKAILFVACLAIIIILSVVCKLSLMDLVVCCLAFLPTGWGLIVVSLIRINPFSFRQFFCFWTPYQCFPFLTPSHVMFKSELVIKNKSCLNTYLSIVFRIQLRCSTVFRSFDNCRLPNLPVLQQDF